MNSQKLDAVLPLTLKDYERFKILHKSLQLFFKDLRICWVVTRDSEFEKVKALLKDEHYQVIQESAIIPELIIRKPRGWYRQQLIKMAIAEKIETEFYLTLDADVICTKPVCFSELIRNGRAITNISKLDLFPEWYRWAERVLGLPRSGLLHGVTPALLSKEGMISLHNYLSQKVNPAFKSLSNFLPKESILRSYLVSWRGYLLRNLPWTEYSLYSTFLEGMGLYEKYHIQGGDRTLYDSHNSVWYKEHFSSWKLENVFKGEEDCFFCVVQAKRGISPNEVWEKVGAYLHK